VAPSVVRWAPITREKTNIPVQMPSSESELALASEANLQEMVIGEALTRTFTIPLPLHLPANDSKKSVSCVRAAEMNERAQPKSTNLVRFLFMAIFGASATAV